VTTRFGAMSAPEQVKVQSPIGPPQTPTAKVCVLSSVPPWIAPAVVPVASRAAPLEHPIATPIDARSAHTPERNVINSPPKHAFSRMFLRDLGIGASDSI